MNPIVLGLGALAALATFKGNVTTGQHASFTPGEGLPNPIGSLNPTFASQPQAGQQTRATITLTNQGSSPATVIVKGATVLGNSLVVQGNWFSSQGLVGDTATVEIQPGTSRQVTFYSAAWIGGSFAGNDYLDTIWILTYGGKTEAYRIRQSIRVPSATGSLQVVVSGGSFQAV